MASDETPNPDEEFQELLRQLFGADASELDPEMLSKLSGMPIDAATMRGVMAQLQNAFANADEGVSWDAAKRQALHLAGQSDRGIAAGTRADLDRAFVLANLWLSGATTISELPEPASSLTRSGWVEATMPVWQELAEPVATGLADALTATLREQAPEDMQGVVQNAGRLMRSVGGSLMATQFGDVIGRLSTEVVSGSDVGIPVLPDGRAAILPQNFADFGAGLEIPDDQLALYLATRELAHARLFRHARWLRLHVISQVTDYARGRRIDTALLEDLAGRFDPSNPEEIRTALESGSFLMPDSDEQRAVLTRLETLLATIEGWVDVVTTEATALLPSAERIGEAVRRRRAVGGPAERTLASLGGLELRPRRMREAATMWRAVGEAAGIADRDALWDYPDLIPTAADIDDPAGLVARVQARARGEEAPRDEMDDALAALLAEESGDDAPGTPGPDAPEH